MDQIAAGGPAGWDLVERWAGRQAGVLAAPAAGSGRCPTCFGPAPAGRTHCFPCRLHLECAGGSLADVVVPVAYAQKGSAHARNLWLYKSGQPGAEAARRYLAMLLVAFLRPHGPCVWRAAGWRDPCDAGRLAPTHVAVVPSSRGRDGPHPLRSLAEPYLRLPWASIRARGPAAYGDDARDLDPERFEAGWPAGATGLDPAAAPRVLLLDDTWTTGASVQSAAMALRRAGAVGVAAVVLGRHLARAEPGVAAPSPFSPARCAVHQEPGSQ